MDLPCLAEADFVFGRMNIDVYPISRKLQIQNIDRMTTMKHHIAVGLTDRVAHQLVANSASVDVKILLIHLPAVVMGQAHPTEHTQIMIGLIDIDRVLHKIWTEHPGESISRITRC